MDYFKSMSPNTIRRFLINEFGLKPNFNNVKNSTNVFPVIHGKYVVLTIKEQEYKCYSSFDVKTVLSMV